MDAAQLQFVLAILGPIVAFIGAYMVFKRSGKANEVNERAGELQWVKTLKDDAIETRLELDRCQEKVRELSRQLTAAQQQADNWYARFEFARRTAPQIGLTPTQILTLFGEEHPPPPPNGTRLIS